jgi:hypothetical protein
VRTFRILPVLLSGLLFSLLSLPGGGEAQTSALPERARARLASPAPVPFGPGEILEYDVKLGWFGKRGEGYMAVVGLDSIRGRTVYHVAMGVKGGLPLARVDDLQESWFDISNLVSLRFIQDLDEPGYERYRHFEIFPEELRWERKDNGNSGPIANPLPLDDISFFYFVRSLPLEVGKEYSFERYFKEDGNPVIVRVLRKDTVEVPAGTFPTIVVEPVIQTEGAFEEGKAELFFSDDENRHLVLMTSKMPVIGSLSLHLRSITEGVPLRPLSAVGPEEIRTRLSLPPSSRAGGTEPGEGSDDEAGR